MYADIEKILVGWLAPRFPTARLCTELPNTLAGDTIQVVQFGGAADEIPFADATVDIDTYALTRLQARVLSEQVRHAVMYDLPGTKVDGAIVLSAFNFSAPSWAPHDNTTVRRMNAAYRIRTHNPI